MNDHTLTSPELIKLQDATEGDLPSFMVVRNSLKKCISECAIIDRCNLKLEESVGQGMFYIRPGKLNSLFIVTKFLNLHEGGR